MAIEDDDIRDNGSIDDKASAEKPEKVAREPREVSDDPKEDAKPKSIRDSIKSAIKEHAAPKIGRPRKDDQSQGEDKNSSDKEAVAKDAAPKSDHDIPKKDEAKATLDAPQAAVKDAPPPSLSKEVRAQWDKLDPIVRSEFLRREADAQKGVDQLKARYKAYDDAFTPVRDELSALGKTEAEGMKMLVEWRQALRGPHKAQAFRALAQSEGIDLATLIAPRQPQAAQQTQQPTNDPASILRPYIDPITQKLNALETNIERQNRERVDADIQSFSRDKPHFDRVRVSMGQLMASGLVPGANPKEIFDEAYNRACRMDPEVFAAIQAEQQAKREEDAKAAQEAAAKKAAEAEAERKRKEQEQVDKARKASVGPRNGSPAGMATSNKAKGQSVGDSLRAALKEVRGSI